MGVGRWRLEARCHAALFPAANLADSSRTRSTLKSGCVDVLSALNIAGNGFQ
jgi:hypothetical protein